MTDRPLQKCGPNNEHGLKLRIDQLTGENARLKAELEKVKVERDELLGITQAHEGNIFDMRGVIATLEREKAEQRDRIAELEKDKVNLLQACAHLFDAWNHNLGRLYEAMGTDSPRIESIALAMRQLESEINAAMKKEGA